MKSIFENVDCILTPGTGSQKKMYSELSAFRKVREDHFEFVARLRRTVLLIAQVQLALRRKYPTMLINMERVTWVLH